MIPSHLASRVFSVLLFFVPTGYAACVQDGHFPFLVVVSKSHDEFPFWFWVVIQEREKL
jgi:hypothetical protein